MIENDCVWTDDLITGEKVVDFQHKQIFSYLNMLIAAANDEKIHLHTLKKVIDGLIEYTVLHFEDEEKILKKLGYPDLAKHQKIHHNCAKQVLGFKKRFEKNEIKIDELIDFVKSWVLEHIKKEDMKALRYKKKM